MTDSRPAVEDLYRSMGRTLVRFFGRTPGSTCLVAPYAILGCSGLDSMYLNCGVVFGDGLNGEDPAEDRLSEFVRCIRERRVGGYVCLSQSVQRRLEPFALELGLEPLTPIPLMARPAGNQRGAAPASSHLVVERVASAAGLAAFLEVSEAAFDLPRGLYGRVVTEALLDDGAVAAYLCRRDGSAVAGVCVVDAEGVVGISGMATLPAMQGRGIGAHVLDAILRAHGDRAHAFYLTSSPAGSRLYGRFGFETVDSATAWVVPSSHA